MSVTAENWMAWSLDPCLLFHDGIGSMPDPWQAEVLRSTKDRIILNCCRQAGKSTVVAALALHTALFTPNSLVLLLSKAQRQAGELFRKVLDFYNTLRPLPYTSQSALKMELSNGSRIVALPGKESNIRSFSGVKLLVIDEAARVGDDLYKSVRPMLAVSNGKLVALSTPYGRRGFFYDEWTEKTATWQKFQIDAYKNPRISKTFLDEERMKLGESWYRQEYECNFDALEGLVYPDFARCIVDMLPPLKGRHVGGVDFGFHNPFAAIWGVLTDEDVLYLTGEHYKRESPLSQNAEKMPSHVRWYADPAGANEIAELRCANFIVSKGDNSLRAGIAAITSRLQTGRLKVLRYGCPNLIDEAGLYRYPNPAERAIVGENPIDDDNHALGALRYLISRLDQKFMVRFRRGKGTGQAQTDQEVSIDPPDGTSIPKPIQDRTNNNWWMDPKNPALWTPQS